MFNNKKQIVYIHGNLIEGAAVELGSVPKIISRYKVEWNSLNLKEALKQIVSRLGTKNIYLMLGDDLVYLLNVLLPLDAQGGKEREAIFEKIQTIIPEDLEDKDWDYKEIGQKDKQKQILVFAPVLTKYWMISKALRELGIFVDAVEADLIAKSRNADPLIGIALKKDIKGKDEENLNIALSETNPDDKPIRIDPNQDKSPNGRTNLNPKEDGGELIGKGYLYALLIVFVIGAIIIGLSLYSRSMKKIAIPSPVPTIQSQ